MTHYCPKCYGEFEDWVEKCLDCGSELVDNKPDKTAKPKSNIIVKGDRQYAGEAVVPVASYKDVFVAELDKGILESEGVIGMITGADRFVSEEEESPFNGSIVLVVKEADAEKAKEILSSIERNITETYIPEADDSETSPD
jgi:hypothetical protein